MKISYAKGRSPGVTTLMYVGDTDPTIEGVSRVELGVGVVGALAALCGQSAITKLAGAIVAGFVGFDVYQARKG
jgi:hypothetical protein